MSNDAVGITKNGIRTLRRMKQQLRETPHNALQRTPYGSPILGKEFRTGITTTNSANATYPTTGNTFVVAYEWWTFTETPGKQDLTYNKSQQCVIARTIDNGYVSENTHVTIVREQSKKGRRWWILPQSQRLKAKVEKTSGIQRDTSGLVRIWQNGLATNRTETAWLDWLAKKNPPDKVSFGKEIIIQYYPDQAKWIIELAECE